LNAIFTQEDVILLVYFHYQVLRTGDLELYMSVMAQMAILFNIWYRKHCGCDYQKLLYPTTGNAKNSGFSYLWKKIEIWHSLLRVHTQSDDAMAIEKGANTLETSGFLTTCETFVPRYTQGESSFDYWMMVGKSADFMLQVFSEIAKNMKNPCGKFC